MKPGGKKRYVAGKLSSGRFVFNAIYDTETKSYPALIKGLCVPQSFDTPETAQKWADDHLNKEN